VEVRLVQVVFPAFVEGVSARAEHLLDLSMHRYQIAAGQPPPDQAFSSDPDRH
jgi:hypothetical protein